MDKRDKLVLLSSLFAVSIVVANIASVKIMSIGPWVVDAGTLVFPITFLVSDTIAEVYGKRTAYRVVITGFICMLFALFILTLANIAPPAPFWEGQEAFEYVIGTVPRLVFASMTAYLISQIHDVWAFHFWRNLTRGRHLWFRNNASTAVSQAIDTSLFIVIAFGGTVAFSELISMIVSVYLFKMAFAVMDTPFVYLLVGWCRKGGSDYEKG